MAEIYIHDTTMHEDLKPDIRVIDDEVYDVAITFNNAEGDIEIYLSKAEIAAAWDLVHNK